MRDSEEKKEFTFCWASTEKQNEFFKMIIRLIEKFGMFRQKNVLAT